MKRCTMMGLFFAALSLTINAQNVKSSSSNSQVGKKGIESQLPPSRATQVSSRQNGLNNPQVYGRNRENVENTQKLANKSHIQIPSSIQGIPKSTRIVRGSIPEFLPRTKADKELSNNKTLEMSDASAERSNLGCSQENPTNAFEIGYTTSKNTLQLIATDITVPSDTDFTMQTITVNIHHWPGITILSADINFYDNGVDVPGAIKSTQAALVPVSQTVIGSNNGYDISEVVFNINPELLSGQAGVPTTYWISLYLDMSSNDLGYIDSTSASIVGNPLSYTLDAGVTWFSYPGYDVVYSFEGNCGPMGGGVSCSEENPNDFTFEEGYNCSSDFIFKTANDLTVAANVDFTLEHITASIMVNNPILNVNVNYYDDAGGFPGALIGSETSVTIDSQDIIGNNLGYDIHELKASVTPFTFSGQAGISTTYWIELSISDGSIGFVYWVATSSSMIGNPIALYDAGWQYPNPAHDGVYIWEGSCSPMGGMVCMAPTDIMVNSVTETTADISWTAGGSETDWIVQYGMAGFDPNTQGTAVAVSGSPNTTIIGLMPGTNYDVYLKADCGSDQSDFTGPISFTTTSVPATTYFITTWKTTVANENINIPTTGSGYFYSVDWGDGATDSGITGDATHSYGAPGIYTVKINGSFPRIYFNNGGDRLKIRTIEQWGTIQWTSMNAAYAGAENLVSNATDMPDLSMVTDMSGAFAYARKFNGDANFGNWNVSNVTNMHGLFAGGSIFNSPIGSWDVSNVTDMENMFYGATIFNQDLSSWNVGNVNSMKNMFSTAMAFNQDIGNWNVSNVTNMYFMFYHANKFDQDLGNWDVSNVTNMTNMFVNVTLSTAHYDALLNGWSALPLKSNVKFSGGKSKYCAGESARAFMISNFNWTITDGGKNCGAFNARMGENNNSALAEITLYPNPMKGLLNLGNPFNFQLESLSIFDLTGRLVQKVDLNGMNNETAIDVSKLSRATYLILVQGKDEQASKLLIKE